METNLMVIENHEINLPKLKDWISRTNQMFSNIESFDDLKRIFLEGEGLSKNTYDLYLEGVKQFYNFLDGLHPLQVIPADIERFYDYLITKKLVDRPTARLRIQGLKKFYANIQIQLPFFVNPFDSMPDKLKRKLSKPKNGNRQKAALTRAEVRHLLSWMGSHTTPRAESDYAIILFLLTSGLRSFEMLQLRWKDLEECESKYTVNFTGKGDYQASQEIPAETVKIVKAAFTSRFGKPHPDDFIFHAGSGPHRNPLSRNTLWRYLSAIGAAARAEEILTRDIEFSAHLFRRTYGTLLYKAGMDIKSVQLKLRHKSMNVTAAHYIDSDEPAAPFLHEIIGAMA